MSQVAVALFFMVVLVGALVVIGRTLADEWQPPIFPVTGDDLIARGITPGKKMGELLRKLEEEWEESGYRLGKKELLSKLLGIFND